jgi:hypothetical protein
MVGPLVHHYLLLKNLKFAREKDLNVDRFEKGESINLF